MARDLMNVYNKVYRDCAMGTTQTEVYEMVVAHPAPRFYIDPRMAHLRISPMMRGDRRGIEKLSPLKRKMYEDLFETVLKVAQKKGFWGKSLYCLIRQAVMEPAPRFYISAKRMEQIWKAKTLETRKSKYKRIKTYEKTDKTDD